MAKNRHATATEQTPPTATEQTPPTATEQTPPTATEQTPPAATERMVSVRAVYPPFIDLIKDVRIGGAFKTVEWHPWLQANIDAGLLLEETE